MPNVTFSVLTSLEKTTELLVQWSCCYTNKSQKLFKISDKGQLVKFNRKVQDAQKREGK